MKMTIRNTFVEVVAVCLLIFFAGSVAAQTISVMATPAGGGEGAITNITDGTLAGPGTIVSLDNCDAGDFVGLLAYPAIGYKFVAWKENGVPISFDNPTPLLSDGNPHVYNAFFVKEEPHYVTASVGAGSGTLFVSNDDTGEVDSGNPVSVSFYGNSQITVRAIPSADNQFVRWEGDISSTASIYSFTALATNHYNISAIFVGPGDYDGDGMPDIWESNHGLDPTNAADAVEDPDNDGLVNEVEYRGYNGMGQTNPHSADTDGDGMRDGWEAYWKLDPTSGAGPNGGGGNPDGDMFFNPKTGLPSRPYSNLEEYKYFVGVNGGEDVDPANFIGAMRVGTDPLNADTDGDKLPDGWEVTYELLPTLPGGNLGENGANGNPDGDFLYNNSGTPIPANQGGEYRNIDEYNRWANSETNSGTINELGCTDPKNSDTDNDGMPDGWEQTYGGIDTDADGLGPGGSNILDDWNPNPLNGRDAGGNPDGDFEYVESTGNCVGGPNRPYVNIEEYEISAIALRGATTHPRGFNPAGTNPDVDDDRLPDHWEVIFGYDPWSPDTDSNGTPDGDENPDGDFMAWVDYNLDGIKDPDEILNEVYVWEGFSPLTGYAPQITSIWNAPSFTRPDLPAQNTAPYSNIDEMLGNSGSTNTFKCNGGSTSPRTNDTDGDGMHDGWEYYVGLSPLDAKDAGYGGDDDGLNNLQEFQCMEIGNLAQVEWANKIWPTDPDSEDTDGDQVYDGDERVFMGGSSNQVWNGSCFTRGGMNPTGCDTDGDHIPDAWEREYAFTTEDGAVRNGMDATQRDATEADDADNSDFDKDGLANYQEYWAGAVTSWQYEEWLPGKMFGEYDAFDFFAAGQPKDWDWHFWSDALPNRVAPPAVTPLITSIPFNYLKGVIQNRNKVWFSTSDPLDNDTDADSMDDYYEIFHGLNPLFGGLDIYKSKINTQLTPANMEGLTKDVHLHPYISGHPSMDIDQDGLPNSEEALFPAEPHPTSYHTDPSPHWLTDDSYQQSWPNLYYSVGTVPWFFSMDGMGAPPSYIYSFEEVEGYDSDNDNLADQGELKSGAIPGSTDPLTPESPIKRRALYLDGTSAARTRGTYYHGSSVFKNWTVEAWVRPESAASGKEQVLVSRPIMLPDGNPMDVVKGVRWNFRMGIHPNGTPYAMYTGSGFDGIFVDPASSGVKLPDNKWTHMVASYDGAAKKLRLYLNGQMVGATPSAVIPANGFFSVLVYSSPIVIGSDDAAPGTFIGGSRIWTGPKAGGYPGGQATVFEPDLVDGFNGWIDEVRIWDGVRSQEEIQANMTKRLKMEDVRASLDPDDATLTYLYTFDSLPDPDHDQISPEGFDRLNGRPNDGVYAGVEWWRTSALRSKVYNDYEIVQWIENAAAHMPVDPVFDSIVWAGATSNEIIEVITDITTGTDTNGLPTATTNITTNVTYEVNEYFPNSSNPYNYGYYTSENAGGEDHAAYTANNSLFNDMLPLNHAEADEDVDMWDEGGTGLDAFDTDKDGLPDYWEERYGFDPLDPDGENGGRGDSDADGLDNLAEYNASLDPQNAYSSDNELSDNGLFDYDQTNRFGLTMGELYDDGDGMPNLWEQSYNSPLLSPYVYDADMDADGDDWSNYAEYRAGTDPMVATNYPQPLISGTFYYDGVHMDEATEIKLWLYQTPEMDGVPFEVIVPLVGKVTDFQITTTPADGTFSHLKEGELYILAFMDIDGVDGYSAGDPVGLEPNQPITLNWGDIEGLKFYITDTKPGFWRYSWDAAPGSSFNVSISSLGGGSPVPVIERTLDGSRPFIHEGDFYNAGLNDGLFSGTWRLAVNGGGVATNFYLEVYTNITVETLTAPIIVAPRGTKITESQVHVAWTAEDVYSSFEIQVLRNGVPFLAKVIHTPHMLNGKYQYTMPWLAQDEMPDGDYTWRIRGCTAYGVSAWAQGGWFTVDLDAPESIAGTIGGNLSYIGKVTNGVFVIQAFGNAAHNGPVLAQTSIVNTSVSGVRYEVPFALKGLHVGTYYVKGFLDQNDDLLADAYESHGKIEAYGDIYTPRGVAVPPDEKNEILVIRDVDLDTDRVADAWEIQNFGSIEAYAGQDAHPTHPGFTVFDVYQMNHYYPWNDSDGDLISDHHEHFYYGTSPLVADDYLHKSGLELKRRDSDGDGYSDAIEIALGKRPFHKDSTPLHKRLFQIDKICIENGELKVSYSFVDGISEIAKGLRARVEMTGNPRDWSGAFVGPDDLIPRGLLPMDDSKEISFGIEPDAQHKFFKIDWDFE